MRKLVLFFILSLAVHAALSQRIHELYDYPVRPGSAEWKSARNHEELRNINQIPVHVIQKMDTQSLIGNVIRYPLIGDILIFSSFSDGIEQLKKNFFAFDSLLNRSDVIEELIPVYEGYEPDKVNELHDPVAIGEYMLGLSLLEFIISDRIKNNAITAVQKHRLSIALISKFKQKENLIDKYGETTLSTCLWAANQLVTEAMLSEQWHDDFLRGGFVLNRQYLDVLKGEIEKLL